MSAAVPEAGDRRRLGPRLRRVESATWWLVGILVAFGGQASVAAVVFRRSIYDEDYHLAAVQHFSRGFSPFDPQPSSLTGVGDLERYGSYLYHYLLSFPWRWSAGLPEEHRVVLLRLITVLIVVAALAVARGLARDLGLSPAAANVAVVLVAASPLTLFLAASVNYDNLLLLLVVLMSRSAIRLVRAPRVDPVGWLAFLSWAALACVTKYVALPVVAVLGLAVLARQAAVARRTTLRPPPGAWSWRRPGLLVAAVATALALALVVERYVVNLVRFGSLQPDCALVQSVRACRSWGPWARNEQLDAAFPDRDASIASLVEYAAREWLPAMLRYSTLTGVVGEDGVPRTSLGPNVGGVVVVLGTLTVAVLLVLGAGRIARDAAALTLLGGGALYMGALFAENYSSYLSLGEPVSIQGRYVLPFLPLLLALAVRACADAVAVDLRSRRVVARVLVGLALVATTQGGWLLGVVAASDREWVRPGRMVVLYDAVDRVASAVVLPDALVPDPRVAGS